MAPVQQLYERLGDDKLRNRLDGTELYDHTAGFYRTSAGENVAPGWRVSVGWDNFKRVLFSEGIRGPMLEIFIWTVALRYPCCSPSRSVFCWQLSCSGNI